MHSAGADHAGWVRGWMDTKMGSSRSPSGNVWIANNKVVALGRQSEFGSMVFWVVCTARGQSEKKKGDISVFYIHVGRLAVARKGHWPNAGGRALRMRRDRRPPSFRAGAPKYEIQPSVKAGTCRWLEADEWQLKQS